MAISLRDINKPLLASAFIVNVIVFLIFQLGGELSLTELGKIKEQLNTLAPGFVGIIFVGVVTGLLDHQAKARLVFWKWTDPLPASRAFSNYLTKDPRIDRKALEGTVDSFPADPAEQNALWYRWYREYKNEAAVVQVHRDYLFYRDYAGMAFVLLLVLVPLVFSLPGILQQVMSTPR